MRGGPRFSTRNLFVGMLEAFKVRPPEKLQEALDELIPCLQAMVGGNTLCVVALDDAQAIAENELTTLLGSMLYLNGRDESLLRIALAAPPELEERIPDLLPRGADLPYSSLSLEPLDDDRAERYLGFRLERAGLDGESPLDAAAVAALNERAGGLPAALHTAAAGALESAWGEPGAAVAGGAAAPAGEELPPELLGHRDERGDAFGGRTAKLALGALAALMIIGGLLLFRTAPDDSETRYRVVEERKLETERLRLLQEDLEREDDPAPGGERPARAPDAAGETPVPPTDDAVAGDPLETPVPVGDGEPPAEPSAGSANDGAGRGVAGASGTRSGADGDELDGTTDAPPAAGEGDGSGPATGASTPTGSTGAAAA